MTTTVKRGYFPDVKPGRLKQKIVETLLPFALEAQVEVIYNVDSVLEKLACVITEEITNLESSQ